LEALITDEESNLDDILKTRNEGLVKKLTAALAKANDLSADKVEKLLQIAVDFYADENIDSDEKKLLLIALDSIRCIKPLHYPDLTSVSTTHHQEWTS
jgi:hypothetical protein